MAVARAPAVTVMIVTAAIVITPVGLRADRRAGCGANHRAYGCAASATNRGANTGTDTGADKRATDGILSACAGRHRRQRRQSYESEKGLPHDILHNLWICPLTPQRR
jgi:hypothetical protein